MNAAAAHQQAFVAKHQSLTLEQAAWITPLTQAIDAIILVELPWTRYAFVVFNCGDKRPDRRLQAPVRRADLWQKKAFSCEIRADNPAFHLSPGTKRRTTGTRNGDLHRASNWRRRGYQIRKHGDGHGRRVKHPVVTSL